MLVMFLYSRNNNFQYQKIIFFEIPGSQLFTYLKNIFLIKQSRIIIKANTCVKLDNQVLLKPSYFFTYLTPWVCSNTLMCQCK